MTSYQHMLSVISLLSNYIEKELGGIVSFIDDKAENGVILRWKRYDPKTKKTSRFSHKISYDEIELIKQPFTFGDTIIDKYKEGIKK